MNTNKQKNVSIKEETARRNDEQIKRKVSIKINKLLINNVELY